MKLKEVISKLQDILEWGDFIMKLEEYDFVTGGHTYVLTRLTIGVENIIKGISNIVFFQIKPEVQFVSGDILTILFEQLIEELKLDKKYQVINKLKSDFAVLNNIAKEINNELYITSPTITQFLLSNEFILIAINRKYKDYLLNKDSKFKILSKEISYFNPLECGDLCVMRYELNI